MGATGEALASPGTGPGSWGQAGAVPVTPVTLMVQPEVAHRNSTAPHK